MEKKPTQAEIAEWKKKADQWDNLDSEIGKFYEGPNGEPPEKEGDLGDIGEVAASAFGWI